ncbi:amphiphysin [Mantella aurantiaca]
MFSYFLLSFYVCIKPDSSKSLSLCNLAMAETQACGSGEELNTSENDVPLSRVDIENNRDRQDENENISWKGQIDFVCQQEVFSSEISEENVENVEEQQSIKEMSNCDMVLISDDSVFEDIQDKQEEMDIEKEDMAITHLNVYENDLTEDMNISNVDLEDISTTVQYEEEEHLNYLTGDRETIDDSEKTDADVVQDDVGQMRCTTSDTSIEDATDVGFLGCDSQIDTLVHEHQRHELTDTETNKTVYLAEDKTFVEECDSETESVRSSVVRKKVYTDQNRFEFTENCNTVIQDSGNKNKHLIDQEVDSLGKRDDVIISDTAFNGCLDIDNDKIWPDNWDPSCTTDSWGESYIRDCQTHEFSIPDLNSSYMNEVCFLQTNDNLDKIEQTLVENENETQSMFMIQPCSNFHATTSCPQAMFCIRNSKNVSCERPSSPRDNETNSSDLSEDEIANRRYGSLYQELDHDKEEVSPLSLVRRLLEIKILHDTGPYALYPFYYVPPL